MDVKEEKTLNETAGFRLVAVPVEHFDGYWELWLEDLDEKREYPNDEEGIYWRHQLCAVPNRFAIPMLRAALRFAEQTTREYEQQQASSAA